VRLERHEEVVADDLPAIYAYIARNNPAAGERVLDAIGSTFEQILGQPACGVLYPSQSAQFAGVRMIPVN
jgi:plasmid stabilization system protein ParE